MRNRLIAVLATLVVSAASLGIAQELTVWVRSTALEPAFEAYNEQMASEGKDVRVRFNLIDPEDFPARFTTALVLVLFAVQRFLAKDWRPS